MTLDKHLIQSCEFVVKQCRYCDQSFLGNSIYLDHLENHCLLRWVECEDCKKDMLGFELTAHVKGYFKDTSESNKRVKGPNGCKGFVPCTERCGEVVRFDHQWQHDLNCSNKVIGCMTCKDKFMRKYYDDHMKENVQRHLAIVMKENKICASDLRSSMRENIDLRNQMHVLKEEMKSIVNQLHVIRDSSSNAAGPTYTFTMEYEFKSIGDLTTQIIPVGGIKWFMRISSADEGTVIKINIYAQCEHKESLPIYLQCDFRIGLGANGLRSLRNFIFSASPDIGFASGFGISVPRSSLNPCQMTRGNTMFIPISCTLTLLPDQFKSLPL